MVNAIGALCLNQTGQEQLESRPSIIPGIFSIFTSEKHTKVLLDKENAVLIGATMDELIRHHPTIKEAVFDSIKATLSKIEDLGRASDIPTNIKGWYQLAPISSLGEQELSSMEGIEAPLDDVLDPTSRDGHSEDDSLPRSHDNRIVSFIDVTCRVSHLISVARTFCLIIPSF
jgi:E3 ubiquitin-protein ligase HUWE1